MPGRRTPPIPDRLAPAMADQGVDEGTVRVTRRRVDNQPCGLVDDDQMFILEADLERHRLRDGTGSLSSGKITTKFWPSRTVAQDPAALCPRM